MEQHHGRSSSRRALTSDDLVGREGELAHLHELLASAHESKGTTAFLVGEAGIGKSRLARAAVDEAHQRGCAVLWGRAVQAPTAAPYRALAEAMSSAVRAGAGPDPDALGPFRLTLGRLVPEWRVHDDGAVDDSLVGVAEAALRFLGVLARTRGAVLVLEDLHWADPETLAIVEYLADNPAARTLCLVTTRDEPGTPGIDLARSLQARHACTVLQLSPLRQAQVAELVASCLGSADVPVPVVELAARADGVPFLVEELIAAAVSAGALVEEAGRWRVRASLDDVVPASFVEGMRRRMLRLRAESRAVVVAAATLGRRFPWELLPAMTGLPRAEVLAALHEAVDAQVLTFQRDDGSFRFRHALSRDAVVAGIFPAEIEDLSNRALDAVEAEHADLGEGWAELAADLAIAARRSDRAAGLLLEVGRRAVGRGALASAEAVLQRARDLAGAGAGARLDIDECLLHVLALAGKHQPAMEIATSLLAQLGDDPAWARRRLEIRLRQARVAIAATRWDEASGLLDQARTDAGAATADDLRARLDAVEAQATVVSDPSRGRTLARAALERAERLGLAEVACEALEVLGRIDRSDDLVAAEAAFTRALALAEVHGLAVWRARALQELGAIDMLRGRPLDRLDQARDAALAVGAVATAAVVDVQLAAGLVLSDDPEAGAAAARRSADLSRRHKLDQTLAAALALEAYAHARARRRAEVQRCVEEARSLAHDAADIEVKASTASAVLALVEEDRAMARHHLCVGLAAVVAAGGDCSVAPGIGVLALLRQLDGADDAAPQVRVPVDSVHFIACAFLRYADAVAAGRDGDTTSAEALVAEADRLLRDHAWFRQLGRRLVAEAAVAGRWGDPGPSLREALDFFERRGDEQLASACRSLLRQAGAPVPRRRSGASLPGELRGLGVTPRELEVLRLLATGMANREIAARLYLSPRTVERHVANLTAKAGLARRAELVAFAARNFDTGARR